MKQFYLLALSALLSATALSQNNDLSITTGSHGEYTSLTVENATSITNFELKGTIYNTGSLSMANVSLGCDVWIDGTLSTTVYAATTEPVLVNGDIITKTIVYTPSTAGNYTFKFFPVSTISDDNTVNDTLIDATPFAISPSYLARDNGNVVGALGIGAGNGGYVGQVYNIETTTQFIGTDVAYSRGYAGTKLALAVFNTDASGVPTTLLTTTDTLLYLDDSARTYFLPFNNGLSLSPGKYLFGVIEFDSTLQISQTSGIYTPNSIYVNWPTSPFGGWAAVEAFGGSFNKPFVIKPKKDACFGFQTTVSGTDETCLDCNDGTAQVGLNGGTAPFTYLWTPGNQTTDSINGLGPNNYTVEITDAYGCTTSGSYTVTEYIGAGLTDLSEIGILVYPNPAVNQLTIESKNQEIIEVTAYDTNGKIVATGKDSLNFIDLASGSYMLAIKTNKAEYRTLIIK